MKKRQSVKDKIAEATLEILGEKSINDIKISEITDRADVARASFYRNFKDFDSVLEYIADKYAAGFNEQIIPMLMLNDYDIWFQFVKEKLQKTYENRKRINEILTDNLTIIAYKMEKKNLANPNHEWNDPFVKYDHVAKITSFYSICVAWIHDGAKVPIYELADFLVKKVLLINK